ncbi:DUF416 family protein [Chitinivorax sp. B]|uniref:DUF416 family protein n=1 Tax=Chitinivorax sp. B TaxID=2502235 RepID=UPI0010F6ADF2|nr:DUF416 family protein [Chitinivorax sp. B]
MMMPAFNSAVLKARLSKLGDKQQLAFGALCCERLIPNYLMFQQDAGWGDNVPVRKALDCVWAYLHDQTPSSQEIKNATASCESAAPNSEDFASLYVTSAQDACFAVCSLLDYLFKNDVDRVVQVATYATDSVDLYVQEIEGMEPNDPQLEQKILAHRLMQRELTQQEADLKAIELAPSLSQEFLAQRKASWNNNGKSNLDLP